MAIYIEVVQSSGLEKDFDPKSSKVVEKASHSAGRKADTLVLRPVNIKEFIVFRICFHLVTLNTYYIGGK